MTLPKNPVNLHARLCQLIYKNNKNLSLLLLLSGIFGFVAGTTTATWQVPIETAQVLMGLVVYDPTTLQYNYHVSVFSILNHIGCILLSLTNSEIISSLLLSGMLGILAMQALVMAIFLVLRNVYLSIFLALCLTVLNFFGPGISYPIWFMGSEHSYGRAGLTFVLYAVLFIAHSKYRVGFFLCGLALWVHPTWGLWLNICLVLTFFMQYRNLKELLVTRNIAFYILGVGMFLAALAWQKIYYPIGLGNGSSEVSEARDIFLNYIKYWDYHRQKFDNIRLLTQGILYAWLSLLLAIFFIKKNNGAPAGERVFFSFVVISTVLSSIFVFVPSWFDPKFFPEFMVTLMPGRFINISIFLCSPLLLASIPSLLPYLTGPKKKLHAVVWKLAAASILIIVIGSRFGMRSAIISTGLAAVLIWWIQNRQTPYAANPVRIFQENPWICLTAITLIALTPAYFIYKSQPIADRFRTIGIPKTFDGAILTTMEHYLLQLGTRVGTITPHLDGYVYAGSASLIGLNQLTKDIFGISLSVVPPANMQLHQSIIATIDYKATWESRACEEWERLSKKYHFGLVLVPASMQLRLPQASNGHDWRTYRPTCSR